MRFHPIRTKGELTEAQKKLAVLIRENQDGKQTDDIEVLALLIEAYEKSRIPAPLPTPVAAIKFRMEELGLSPRQLEPFIGSRARVSEILTGKRSLSIDMIRSLHEGLGIPYASLISARPSVSHADSGAELPRYRVAATLFDSTLSAAPRAMHRRTRTQRATMRTDQDALRRWQECVLKAAARKHLRREYEPKALSKEFVRQLATLSSRKTGAALAIKTVQEIGVAVVIQESLPGTFLDGAALLGNDGRPIVALTLRSDRTDNFWFTLLHEIAHIRLHLRELQQGAAPFIDDIEIQSEDAYEKEADELARKCLIPDSILENTRWSAHSTSDDLVGCATRARVHPSIVAGRWQRDFQNYRRFSRMIERDAISPQLSAG